MDIYFNLAAEEYLLKYTTDDYFMVWRGTPAVVIGRHQRMRSEVNVEFARMEGITLARRYSGGGTVYHDAGNINLTFIETSTSPDFDSYLRRTLRFLQSLGITVEGDKRLSIYTDTGLKVSGSAQSVHKNRVLYHCTLLYDTDLEQMKKALTVEEMEEEEEVLDAKYGVPSVRSEVTNLITLLPDPLPSKEFCKFAYRYFLNQSAENQSYTFTAEELVTIYNLRTDKYATEEWIHV